MPRQNRLLLVSPLPPPAGGVETWTAMITQALASDPTVSVSALNTVLRFRRQQDLSLHKRLIFGGAQAVADSYHFVRMVRKIRPDTVHINSSASLASLKDHVMLRYARHMGVRTVLHYHMGFLPLLAKRNNLHWKLVRANMRLADVTLVLGQAMAESLRQADPRLRVQAMPNPIELAHGHATNRLPDGRKEVRFVFIGKVNEEKGAYELWSAFQRLDRQACRLDIVGNNRTKAGVALALQLVANPDCHCTFHGELAREQTMRILRESDVLVLSSRMEGFPYVILEAMAEGKAIVATRVGAIPEMVGEGTESLCAVLVPPADAEALSAGMAKLIEQRSLVVALGENGHRRVRENYLLGTVIDKLKTIWFGASKPSA